MGIVQRIKEFFSGVFPLHLNATVRDLKGHLEATEFMDGLLRLQVEALQEVNREFLQANQGLQKELDDAHEEVRAQRAAFKATQKRPFEVMHGRDAFQHRHFDWPGLAALHRLPDGFYRNEYRLRLELQALRLEMVIPQDVIFEGPLFDDWAGTFATHIAKVAEKEVYEKAIQQLSLHKYRRNLHKEIS